VWTPFSPRQPAVTSTFDLQNTIRSSAGTGECSLSVSSRLSWCIVVTMCLDGQMNKETDERGGQTARKHNTFTNTVRWRKHKNKKTHRNGRPLLKKHGRVTSEIQVRIPYIELLYGRLHKTQHSYYSSPHLNSAVQQHIRYYWMAQYCNGQVLKSFRLHLS